MAAGLCPAAFCQHTCSARHLRYHLYDDNVSPLAPLQPPRTPSPSSPLPVWLQQPSRWCCGPARSWGAGCTPLPSRAPSRWCHTCPTPLRWGQRHLCNWPCVAKAVPGCATPCLRPGWSPAGCGVAFHTSCPAVMGTCLCTGRCGSPVPAPGSRCLPLGSVASPPGSRWHGAALGGTRSPSHHGHPRSCWGSQVLCHAGEKRGEPGRSEEPAPATRAVGAAAPRRAEGLFPGREVPAAEPGSAARPGPNETRRLAKRRRFLGAERSRGAAGGCEPPACGGARERRRLLESCI